MEFFKDMNKNKLYVLVGSVIGAIAAFMPFVSANVLGSSFAWYGIEGDGKITLLASVVSGVVAVLGDRTEPFTKVKRNVILGALVVYWLVIFIMMLSKHDNVYGQMVSFSTGYYFTWIAGIIMSVGLYTKVCLIEKFFKKEKENKTDNPVADEVKEDVREFNEQQTPDASDESETE